MGYSISKMFITRSDKRETIAIEVKTFDVLEEFLGWIMSRGWRGTVSVSTTLASTKYEIRDARDSVRLAEKLLYERFEDNDFQN